MNEQSIRRLLQCDIKLLVAFSLLMQEKHVTKAALKQGISQPAMSLLLQRLRKLFDDEILITTNQGLIASERALQLKPQVELLLNQLDAVVNEQDFEPNNVLGCFRVSVSDATMQFITRKLVMGAMQQAPNLTFELIDRKSNAWALLESGDLDLFFGYKSAQPKTINCEKVYQDRHLLMVAKSHALASSSQLKLSDTVEYLMVNNPNSKTDKLVENRLKELKLSRKIQLSSESLFCLKQAVETGLLIGFFPKSFIDAFVDLNKIKIFELDELPQSEGYMYWHKKTDGAPVNKWMRQQFRDIANSPALYDIN